MKIKFFLLVFLFILSQSMHAQSEEIFAPFVSRLEITANTSNIKLTWKGSSDISGKYNIYRYINEITEENLSAAALITQLADSQNYYIDYPPLENTNYYYAVLITGEDNNLYNILIPLRNKSIKGVSIEESASESDQSAEITDILAAPKNDYILLTVNASKSGRELLIYRSTDPISTNEDLLTANLIDTISSSDRNYKDYPVPGVPYYYCILDSGLFKAGKYNFTAGENTTIIPAEISLSSEKTGLKKYMFSRSRPLPFLSLSSVYLTGEKLSSSPLLRITEKRKLLPSTLKTVKNILADIEPAKEKPQYPVILEIDKAESYTGERYTLNSILSKYFTRNNWQETEKQLNDFLSIHHSKEIENRSHFYLGQAYYFQGKYREAFLEFLLISEEYYLETYQWFNSIFIKLETVP